jgi:hypothetical protein
MGTPVPSTNKSDHHDISEILLKVALSTIKIKRYTKVCYNTILIIVAPVVQKAPECQTKFYFLAHLAKGNVSFCHHLASVVVNFSHFNLLL